MTWTVAWTEPFSGSGAPSNPPYTRSTNRATMGSGYLSSASGYDVVSRDVTTADMDVSADFYTNSVGEDVFMYLRSNGSSTFDFYVKVPANGGAIQLLRGSDNAVLATAGSGSGLALGVSATLRVVVVGTSADVYYGGVQFLTGVTTPASSGQTYAMVLVNTTQRVDNWTASYYTAPASITVTVPAATATTAMLPPAVALTGGTIAVTVPAASATATMLAPQVRLTSFFAAYDLDANASQAMQVRVELSGVLEANPIPVPPPTHWVEAHVRARRLSLVMPDPTLDANGRPT